jgi:nitrogen fixation protein NifU and related proteins
VTSPFGDTILEHFRRPRNRGALASADVSAEGTLLCGDRVRVQLALDGDRITEARFVGDACAVCIAAASLLTLHVVGLSMTSAAAIENRVALGWLNTSLPPAREACGLLPLEVLRRGVREHTART